MAAIYSSLKAMPLDPRRSIPIYRAAFRVTRTWLPVLFLLLPALLLGIDEIWLADLLFSSFLGLRAAFHGNPVRRKIFIALNFVAMGVLLVLSWKMRQKREKASSPEESDDHDPYRSHDGPPSSFTFVNYPSAPPMPKDWGERETPPSGYQCGRPAKRGRHDRTGSFTSPWAYSAKPSAPPMSHDEPSDDQSDGEISLAEDENVESQDIIWESFHGAPRLTKNKTWSSSSTRSDAAGRKLTKSQTSREHGTRKEMEMEDKQEMNRRFEEFIQKRLADFSRENLDVSCRFDDSEIDTLSFR